MQVRMLVHELPVQPTDFVVLAVCIVVAALGAADSSPITIIGTPSESIVTVRKFFICRFRSFSINGSFVGPSEPQFQLRLSLAPSRLPSPLSSLCLSL